MHDCLFRMAYYLVYTFMLESVQLFLNQLLINVLIIKKNK